MASIAFPRPVLLVVVAAGFAAMLVAWAKVVDTLVTVKPVAPATRPDAIIWDDYVFSSRPDLERWLRSRGATYANWARSHPASAAILEHLPPPTATAATATTATTAPVTTTAGPAPATPSSASVPRGSTSHVPLVRDIVLGVLLVLALALGLGALLPAPVRARFPEASARVRPYRDVLAAAAGAISVGVAIGALLG